jgi:hypothetical protein
VLISSTYVSLVGLAGSAIGYHPPNRDRTVL